MIKRFLFSFQLVVFSLLGYGRCIIIQIINSNARKNFKSKIAHEVGMSMSKTRQTGVVGMLNYELTNFKLQVSTVVIFINVEYDKINSLKFVANLVIDCIGRKVVMMLVLS